MKRLLKVFLFVAALSALVSACDDDTSTIGSSLIQDQVKIVVDDSFTLTGHSVASEEFSREQYSSSWEISTPKATALSRAT